MQAKSIYLGPKTKIKEFGRIRRLAKGIRIFLAAENESDMLALLGTFIGEEIEGSHYTALKDALFVEHVDDFMALVEQVPKFLGSIQLVGLLVKAEPETNTVQELILVAEENTLRRVIVRHDIAGVFEDSVSAIQIAGWIVEKF